MNNETLNNNVETTLSDANHLRKAIYEFSWAGQNDPALGQMGAHYPFNDQLMEFKHRSLDLIDRLEQFPEIISELTEGESRFSETAASLLEMATQIKTEIEALEALQEQLGHVIDVSFQDLYQLLMAELTEAVEAVIAEIKTRLIPELKALVVKIQHSDFVKERLSSGSWRLHAKKFNWGFS